MGLGAQHSDLRQSATPVSDRQPERIRVCHVVESLAGDHLAESLLETVDLIDQSRFEVSFVALGGLGVVAAALTRTGIQVDEIGSSLVGKAKTIHRLSRRLKKRKIDIVHAHGTSAQFHAAIAAKWSGVPGVVCTQHGRGCGTSRRSLWQFRIANEFTDRVFGTTESTTELCRQQNRTNSSKIHCVPEGIDTDKFFFYGPQDELRAITIAKFNDDYQLSNLVRGARKVVDSYPHFRLKIINETPESSDRTDEKALVDLIQQLHMKHHVEFLHRAYDLSRLLSSGGFFVTASETSEVNYSILQAMATGLPVLIPQTLESHEFVTPGQNGRTISGTDPDQIGFGLLSMISERPMWPIYGDESRRRVEQIFNLKTTITTYQDCYSDLVQMAIR